MRSRKGLWRNCVDFPSATTNLGQDRFILIRNLRESKADSRFGGVFLEGPKLEREGRLPGTAPGRYCWMQSVVTSATSHAPKYRRSPSCRTGSRPGRPQKPPIAKQTSVIGSGSQNL